MGTLLVIHPLLRTGWNSLMHQFPSYQRRQGTLSRFEQRISFDYVFAIVYLFVLHGFSAFKVLLILNINYRLATKLPRQYVPAATWLFNVPVLFANELCQGYHYKTIASYVFPPLVGWGEWMDGYGGLVPRWEILFNLTILRLVSFNLDYYWSVDKKNSTLIEVG